MTELATRSTPTRRPWLWYVLLAAVVTLVALPGIGVRATYGAHTTADEPHYLLTAITLAEDGDLDVSDEMAAGRYRAFHEAGLPPQAAPQEDGSEIVPHDPLLPAMLAPAWELGGWRGAKALLALLLGATAAATAWVAHARRGVPLPWATGVTGLLFLSAPLSVYGTQVYPEVPAALAVVVGVGALLGRPGWRNATVVAVALVALPWLAVKYVPVAATVGGVWVWRWWRAGARRPVVVGSAALAVAGVAYVVAHLAWYGGLTVYAAGDFFQEHGGELTVVGLAPNYLGRARRLVGLLVDHDFGLIVWQPLWASLPAAVAVALRRRADGAVALLAPLAAGWLTATFIALTMQGWWFPGRQVVVVLPLAAVLIAELASAFRWARIAALAVGLTGVLSLGWLWVDGLARRLTLIVDFATVGDPLFAARRALLPDYLDVTAWTWTLQTIWTVALGATAVLAWRAVDRRADREELPDVAAVDSGGL